MISKAYSNRILLLTFFKFLTVRLKQCNQFIESFVAWRFFRCLSFCGCHIFSIISVVLGKLIDSCYSARNDRIIRFV